MNPAKAHSSTILEYFPMMGSTALFMEHVSGNVPIAATNGKQVIFGKGFDPLTNAEKNGVVLHEYLHCVLSHPQRGGLVRMKEGDSYCPTGFNIAADALINHTIRIEGKRRPNIALPEGCIDIDKIRSDLVALKIIDKDGLNPSEVSVEEIYVLLMKARRMDKPQSSSGQSDEKATIEKCAAAWSSIQDMFSDPPDLVADEGTAEELKEKIREQTARFANESRMHGNTRGDLVERIAGDIPKAKVAWQSSFRNLAARHLSRERVKTNRKPSSSMLSHEAMGGARFWEAGRARTPRPRALVIADSSGSITMKDYLKFLGELEGMRRRTSAEIHFALADTEMGEIGAIRETSNLRELDLTGRGGTSFIQPLQKAEELDYDLVIYMSDLEGPFPDSCRLPVIWVSPEDRNSKEPPFGRHYRV